MKLFEINTNISFDFGAILLEASKEEYIEKSMGPKLVAAAEGRDDGKDVKEIINALSKADPSPNKQFLQFIANMYVAKQFRIEDTDKIKKELELFNKVKGKLEKKDINQYKSLDELYKATEKFTSDTEAQKSKKEVKKEIKAEGVKKIIDTPDFKVLVPTTEAAACFYGKGTKWCTAADKDNRFDYYNKQGTIYIILAGDRKFQLHYESDQFMNEKDLDVTKDEIAFLSKFPKYKDFLNMLIKKHYLD